MLKKYVPFIGILAICCLCTFLITAGLYSAFYGVRNNTKKYRKVHISHGYYDRCIEVDDIRLYDNYIEINVDGNWLLINNTNYILVENICPKCGK